MEARRKGSNYPFKPVERIQLKGSDILYDANVMEFKQDVTTTHDTLSTELETFDQIDEEKHWQDVRERAAIAAMQGVMNFFGSIDYNKETIAKLAVEQADALIAELESRGYVIKEEGEEDNE